MPCQYGKVALGSRYQSRIFSYIFFGGGEVLGRRIDLEDLLHWLGNAHCIIGYFVGIDRVPLHAAFSQQTNCFLFLFNLKMGLL